jgi:hypothetical protein
MSLLKGYGLGIFRGFYVVYIAQYMKHGYRNHPFEIPAYDQEYRFMHFCRRHSQHPHANVSMLRERLPASGLIFYSASYRYKEGLPRMMASITLCLMILLLKPVLDGILFLFYLGSRRQQQ